MTTGKFVTAEQRAAFEWCIVYHDLSMFDNTHGPPESSPGLGVLAIVRPDEKTGYAVLNGDGHSDLGYYWFEFENNQWFIGNVFGFVQYMNEPGVKVVRFGRTVVNDLWLAMWDLIEQTFGPKHSWLPGEPRRQIP